MATLTTAQQPSDGKDGQTFTSYHEGGLQLDTGLTGEQLGPLYEVGGQGYFEPPIPSPKSPLRNPSPTQTSPYLESTSLHSSSPPRSSITRRKLPPRLTESLENLALSARLTNPRKDSQGSTVTSLSVGTLSTSPTSRTSSSALLTPATSTPNTPASKTAKAFDRPDWVSRGESDSSMAPYDLTKALPPTPSLPAPPSPKTSGNASGLGIASYSTYSSRKPVSSSGAVGDHTLKTQTSLPMIRSKVSQTFRNPISRPGTGSSQKSGLSTISQPISFAPPAHPHPYHLTASLSSGPSKSRPTTTYSMLVAPPTSICESDYCGVPAEDYAASGASGVSAPGSVSSCPTWSAVDDGPSHQPRDQRSFSPSPLRASIKAKQPKAPKETRKEKKERKRAEEEAFDEETLPTLRDLYDASFIEVVGEGGEIVRFGDLVGCRRTIVVFIRHWFCPLCAQYMNSIISQVTPQALEEADVGLIIIGNGSGKMLPAYKNKALNCPFPMYTDPSLMLYRALGLTRQTGDSGPDSEAGDYLVQSALEATVATIKRATVMPLRNPGHFLQLGGEFVFEGSMNCTYAHRMTTTRSHAPIRDVCREAGVKLEWVHYEPGEGPPPVHRASFVSSENDQLYVSEEIPGSPASENTDFGPAYVRPNRESAFVEENESAEGIKNNWRQQRDEEIARMKERKAARRAGGLPRLGEMRKEVQVKVVGEDDDSDEVNSQLAAFGFIEL